MVDEDNTTLVGKFYAIVDGYYGDSEYFKDVEAALVHYQLITELRNVDSLASDGWEMIESALRERSTMPNE